ncbi:MAG: hypothetical protein BWZ10_01521 [candidate division BRC1 bacterium ADurb.BinA364]|nr:MAG: hypothetical protein BWZ10_01521 [candidate division BRC1 bacterium ADurb.BinA364]
MSEQLAFEQGFGQSPAVDLDQRHGGARRMAMDELGEDFLACAAGALQQHGGFGDGDFARSSERFAHGFADGDDFLLAFLSRKRGLELAVFLLENLGFQGAADQDFQFFVGEWLDQIIVGAFFHRFDGGFGRGEGGHHDHIAFGPERLGLFEHLDAGHRRHFQVGDKDMERLPAEQFQGVARIDGELHLVAFALENALQYPAHLGLVVENEDAACHSRFAFVGSAVRKRPLF